MATRTVIIHDRCTNEDCGRVLHSIREGESGLCSSCWVKGLKPETRTALNKLISAAFKPTIAEKKGDLIDNAIKALESEKKP